LKSGPDCFHRKEFTEPQRGPQTVRLDGISRFHFGQTPKTESHFLDGAVIGNQSVIGAKALVTQGMKIPPSSLVLGAPAKVVRKLTKKERAKLKWWAQKYVDNGAYCLEHKINVGGRCPFDIFQIVSHHV
jgi:hypothetical protein